MAGGVVRELVTLWGFDIEDKALKDLDRGINSIKSSLETVAKITAVTAAGIGFVLNEAGKQEQTNVAFETIIGNAERAHKTIAELQQFAAKTPFTIPGIEQNAKLLLGMGIELERLIPTMKALGDVSAGLSVPLSRIALNFGQVRAQNKLTGREVRDFAVAGIPIIEVLAENLGKTTAEIQKMVSAGDIGFSEVEQAFISMTSAGGRFEDLMIKQSKTLFGLISNAKDLGIIFLRRIGQDILPVAKETVTTFLDWAQANEEIIATKMRAFLANLVDLFKDMVGILGTVKDVMDGLVSLFGGWSNAIKLVSGAIVTFLSLKLLNGLGLMTIALGKGVIAWRTMGNAALFAQAKMAAIPIAIGAVIAAVALIAEDILAFSQGRDSVFGRMLQGLDVIFGKLSEKFRGLADEWKAIVSILLLPIRSIVNGFQSVLSIIDAIRGKIGFMDALGEIGQNITDTFNFDRDSLSGALGFADNAQRAALRASNQGALMSTGQGVLRRESSQTRNNNLSQNVNLNLNVEGMDKVQAENFVTLRLKDELGGILRETVRDGESQVER